MEYQVGELGKWVDKIKGREDALVKVATYDLMDSIDIAPGINLVGSRTPGTIVWDKGDLARSLVSSLNGMGSSLRAADSWASISKLAKAGDIIEFKWTAPYALAIHEGKDGLPGTHWVEMAVSRWPRIVEKAVETVTKEV